MRKTLLMGVAAIAVVAAGYWLLRGPGMGNGRFFADQTYNFETIRVLADNAPAGGDLNEAMQAVAQIKSGDAESWYAAWHAAGERASRLADKTRDAIGKGNALLRAHTYYRAAEFFLDPHDAKRASVWQKNVTAFYAGLDALGVQYERITIPYGEHHLNAVYYPGPQGAEKKPLIMLVGGFDSTMEELYLHFVAAAHQHGYAVLSYEGPGQGSVLRDQGLVFTPEWEKPNTAVLDTFLANHAKPAKIVLIGESMGGYFAPRAAAFDPRIDGVVAYDVFFDGFAIASSKVPPFAVWLHRNGMDGLLGVLSNLKSDPGAKWAQANGMWALGAKRPFDVIAAFKPYTLAPVAGRIRADVLALAGANDHFVPSDQLEAFKTSLTNARSVTTVVYDQASGGAEHCQLGAQSLWQSTVFEWIHDKFE